ncbi:hypothetical protein L1785_11985 [Antribacter sp. KLBMP9083]|uniref:Uncharacterized protein n=1 Tax=Antribacter soli TaxID=2910976 RepID=A0AA41QEK1_9MICO|nr:hypothetical protein [Antribacter soli]MCF4121702.1 hypothetical protein [Antribacter soli]
MTHETGSVAAQLSRPQLATVTYFPLGYEGDDGTYDIEDWDYEIGHVPTMGLALRTTDGAEFFICWEQAEWDFGVAFWEGPPRLIPSARDAAVTVEDHPHWRSRRAEPSGATSRVLQNANIGACSSSFMVLDGPARRLGRQSNAPMR